MECIDQPPATADAPTSRTPSSSSVPSALIERLNARKKNDEAKNTIQQSAKGYELRTVCYRDAFLQCVVYSLLKAD